MEWSSQIFLPSCFGSTNWLLLLLLKSVVRAGGNDTKSALVEALLFEPAVAFAMSIGVGLVVVAVAAGAMSGILSIFGQQFLHKSFYG